MESASHRNAVLEQVALQIRDGMLGKMEDGRREGRVGSARREDAREVIERAGAS
jgi:hypothetical protein